TVRLWSVANLIDIGAHPLEPRR
ncbi:MAG: hypothetical protein QOG14_187, partial [Mycobacterium sp.]|nr:hypothetical protein [Mycobacterium sp.]